MDVRSPTIVVDSWDPIGMMMDGDALISNTKVLQTWRERAEANIITLVEDSSNTSFDSLFDGVVALDRYYEDGRIIRMIQLTKLSGVKVNRPSYLFTLDGGIFQSFSTYKPSGDQRQCAGGLVVGEEGAEHGVSGTGRDIGWHPPIWTIMTLSLAPGVNSAMVLSS